MAHNKFLLSVQTSPWSTSYIFKGSNRQRVNFQMTRYSIRLKSIYYFYNMKVLEKRDYVFNLVHNFSWYYYSSDFS